MKETNVDEHINILEMSNSQDVILLTSIAISSDSKTLVSSSYDNTMKMWDMNNGKLLDTYCN